MGIFFDFTSFLNTLSTELLWFIFLFFCFSSILIFLKIFGYIGLYIYSGIAVIAANIQVLKIVDFFYSPEPVALGTILFASIFLCTDILSEYFGKEKARQNVLIGFSASLCTSAAVNFAPLGWFVAFSTHTSTATVSN